jgi:integrase
LNTLGDHYFDALKAADVQAWVNKEIRAGYSIETVRRWFRVFRTMTRDAIQQIDFPRDPTSRVSFPETPEREEHNALTPDQLHTFLEEIRRSYPRNYALTCVLAFTGLRFCHASGLKWEDLDEAAGVIRVIRKNIRGRVGPVSRRKRAPRQVPLPPELAEILRQHRAELVKMQAKGLEDGWCFPSRAGTLRSPGSLWKAWRGCLEAIDLGTRFTVHGLRRTFNDLARRAGIDAVTTRSLTGHVTEKMREHYSSVQLDEKQRAVRAVVRLVRENGDKNGDRQPENKKAG